MFFLVFYEYLLVPNNSFFVLCFLCCEGISILYFLFLVLFDSDWLYVYESRYVCVFAFLCGYFPSIIQPPTPNHPNGSIQTSNKPTAVLRVLMYAFTLFSLALSSLFFLWLFHTPWKNHQTSKASFEVGGPGGREEREHGRREEIGWSISWQMP